MLKIIYFKRLKVSYRLPPNKAFWASLIPQELTLQQLLTKGGIAELSSEPY